MTALHATWLPSASAFTASHPSVSLCPTLLFSLFCAALFYDRQTLTSSILSLDLNWIWSSPQDTLSFATFDAEAAPFSSYRMEALPKCFQTKYILYLLLKSGFPLLLTHCLLCFQPSSCCGLHHPNSDSLILGLSPAPPFLPSLSPFGWTS